MIENMEADEFDALKKELGQALQQIIEAMNNFSLDPAYQKCLIDVDSSVNRFIKDEPPQHDISPRKFSDTIASLTLNDEHEERITYLLVAGESLAESIILGRRHVTAVRAGIKPQPTWISDARRWLDRFQENMRKFWGDNPRSSKP